MRELCPAWPPVAAVHEQRPQTLRRPVQRGPEAGRTAADDDQVVELGGGCRGQPDVGREFLFTRFEQGCAVRGDDEGQAVPAVSGCRQQPLALGGVDRVPAVGNLVAGEELPYLRRPRRPAVPHHLRARYRPVVRGPPRLQQIVQDGVELLLRRVPRLEQVVVEVDDVDRVDGGAGVRVRGEQDPARAGVDVQGLFQEFDAVHLGHAVIGHDHGHQVAPQLQLPQGIEGALTGLGAHDAVGLAVPAPKVARHGTRHSGVVVHGQDDGPCSCAGSLCHKVSHPELIGVPPIVCSIVRFRSGTR